MVLVESSSKNRSISFRLPEEVAVAIETESAVRNVNPSTLLAEICRAHFGYEGNAGRAGLIAFPRAILVRLMEAFPEEKVVAFAEYMSRDVTTDMMSVLKNEYSAESFIDFIQSWAHSSRIPFRRQLKGNLNTVVIQPELGRNWSLYLGHLLKNVMEELTGRNVKINVSDKSVMFMF